MRRWIVLLFSVMITYPWIAFAQIIQQPSVSGGAPGVAISPGDYTCPTITVNTHGQILGVIPGPCPGLTTYLDAQRPSTCIPNATVINVPDSPSQEGKIQICNDTGTGWNAIGVPSTPLTMVTVPTRPPLIRTAVDIAAAQATMYTFDVTSADVVFTLPNAGDTTQPGIYRGIILAGTYGVIVRVTPPNLLNGLTTDYPSIVGVKSQFTVERINDNEWMLTESVVPAKVSLNLPISGVKFPSSNPAELNNAQTVTRLLFDASTPECAIWQGHIGSNYYGNLQIVLDYKMTSADGTGGISVDVSVMATHPGITADVNTESYDTVNNCDVTTVPATHGYPGRLTCVLANNDSLQADDYLKVKLCRQTADAADNAGGDMEVFGAALQYDGK